LRKYDYEAQIRLGQVALKLSELDTIELDIKVRSEAYFAAIGAVAKRLEAGGARHAERSGEGDVRKLQRDSSICT